MTKISLFLLVLFILTRSRLCDDEVPVEKIESVTVESTSITQFDYSLPDEDNTESTSITTEQTTTLEDLG